MPKYRFELDNVDLTLDFYWNRLDSDKVRATKRMINALIGGVEEAGGRVYEITTETHETRVHADTPKKKPWWRRS